jgi:uncharacterized protein (DUF1786 family)
MTNGVQCEQEPVRRVLCLDIGSGTQDVLYSIPGQVIENCPKFVLPSPAVMVQQTIRRLTRERRNIYLYGTNMGGGFAAAVGGHLAAFLKVAAHPEAALSMADNMDRVREMGVSVAEECPRGFVPVYLSDFDPGFWKAFLGTAGLEYPETILAAAQDHGFHPQASNRLGRFRIWERFLKEEQGRVEELLFLAPPDGLTRLRALQRSIGGGAVADTGAAAVLGALSVPEVQDRSSMEGITVVNVGNSHVAAFLIFEGRIRGVYEHHTGLLDSMTLCRDLERFRGRELTNEEVFSRQGHGCVVTDIPPHAGGFERMFILGPRRNMLKGCGEFLAPGGDMMLAGCFGLLHGARLRGLID